MTMARVIGRIRATLCVAAMLAAALVLAPVRAVPAHAWAWDPTVTLSGKVGCNYAASNTVQWAWISGSDGESGWASLKAGGITRPYSFTFHKVPTSSMTVKVNWGCSIDGSHTTSFGLNRPAVGEGATRDICYWPACRL
jgi:hypothetical protein